MIQANELRIGNLLYFNGNHKHIGTVTSLQPKHIVQCCKYVEYSNDIKIGLNHRFDILYDIENVKPIPLTEEILLKCPQLQHNPIVKIANVFNMNLGRNRELSISCAGTPNLAVFITNKENGNTTDIVTIWNYDYDKELYLHTFQNLIFALTGEELTVNL